MFRIVSVGLLILALAIPSYAIQQKWVGVVGCSNSQLVEQAYRNVSDLDITWNAAKWGADLKVWAVHNGVWKTFDSNLASKGATAVWYPLCIIAGSYPNTDAAWLDFMKFLLKLRQRTQAPLFLAASNGSRESCAADDNAMQEAIVQRAVDLGYAQRSLPEIPPASAPDGNCHFNSNLSTNVGQAAVDFLDE